MKLTVRAMVVFRSVTVLSEPHVVGSGTGRAVLSSTLYKSKRYVTLFLKLLALLNYICKLIYKILSIWAAL